MKEITILHLVHILITGPLLIYISISQPKTRYLYWLLMALGTAIFINFCYMAFKLKLSERHVWFAIHALLFSSLLFFVGWKGTDTPHVGYSLLLAVGIAAIGYHLVRIFQENWH
jgi:hypothetical protein